MSADVFGQNVTPKLPPTCWQNFRSTSRPTCRPEFQPRCRPRFRPTFQTKLWPQYRPNCRLKFRMKFICVCCLKLEDGEKIWHQDAWPIHVIFGEFVNCYVIVWKRFKWVQKHILRVQVRLFQANENIVGVGCFFFSAFLFDCLLCQHSFLRHPIKYIY